jgi:dolichol kinase
LLDKTSDFDSEKWRKSYHLLGLIIPLGYLLYPSEAQAKAILLAAMIFGIFIDIFRLAEPRLRSFAHSLIGALMRPEEKSNLLGSTSLLIASVMTIFVFPKVIAVAALCLLVGGDTAAALVGKRYGRIRIFGRKTLEGTLAFVGAGLILNGGVSLIAPGLTPLAVVAGALVGALVEAVSLPIDDNFAIPIVSGVAMSLARILGT